MFQYSEKTKKLINLIGSGEAAYVPKLLPVQLNIWIK